MASIRCAHCGQTHDSVEIVRKCATQEGEWLGTEGPRRSEDGTRFLSGAPRKRQQPAEPGYYFKDGAYYKVVVAHHGSGRPYAKRAEGVPYEGDPVVWEYARGAVFELSAEHAVTKEQAAEFARLYGRCVRCNLVLTAEESIERAMGPICAGKMGW